MPAASILHELSDPQPTINNVKVEHPAYYCNSYSDQGITDRSTSVDAMVVSAAYSSKYLCMCMYTYIFIHTSRV